ncbi:MAG: tetratricopeptide repeat protein [Limisphaerales bacterium]
MMTTKKSGLAVLSLLVIALSMSLTGCGPPGQSEVLEGRQLVRSAQFDRAIAPLKSAAQILAAAPAPSQSKVWNLLGLAYQGARQFDAASEAYGRALKLDRNNVAADYNLGCLRLDQGNMQGAIDYLYTYVMLRPRDPNGFLRLGTAQYHLALERTGPPRNNLMDSARRNLETAAKLDPAAPSQNALGILELYRKNPSSESLKAAAAYFQFALDRDPRFSPALLNLAILQQRYLNQPVQAAQNYHKYLTLGPAMPRAKEVGELVQQLDAKNRMTITPLAHANHTNPPPPSNSVPSNPAPLISANPPPPSRAKPSPVEPVRAKAPEVVSSPPPQQEKPQASVPPPTPAPSPLPPPTAPAQAPPQAPPVVSSNQTPPPEIEPVVSPSPPPAATRKTFVQKINPLHWFSPESKANPPAGAASSEAEPPLVAKGARYSYPPRVTLIPGNRSEAVRWAEQGAQARQQGRLHDAVLAYQQAVIADPTYYEANEALGLAALDNREYTLALETLNRALILQNDSANARYAFAWTLQRRGYYEDAARELDKMLTAHPEEVRGHLLLGKIYAEKLNQPKLAREHYARALSLDPQNPQALAIRSWLEQNH